MQSQVKVYSNDLNVLMNFQKLLQNHKIEWNFFYDRVEALVSYFEIILDL